MKSLLPELKESLLRADIRKLSLRLDKLRQGQADGRLGPRVVRARLRLIREERQKLAAIARELGFDCE